MWTFLYNGQIAVLIIVECVGCDLFIFRWVTLPIFTFGVVENCPPEIMPHAQ